MKISMNQNEVTEVLRKHFASRGISTSGTFNLTYTAGRKGKGMTVDIDIEDTLDDLPSFPKEPPELRVVASAPIESDGVSELPEAEPQAVQEDVIEEDVVEETKEEQVQAEAVTEVPAEEAPVPKKTTSLFARPVASN